MATSPIPSSSVLSRGELEQRLREIAQQDQGDSSGHKCQQNVKIVKAGQPKSETFMTEFTGNKVEVNDTQELECKQFGNEKDIVVDNVSGTGSVEGTLTPATQEGETLQHIPCDNLKMPLCQSEPTTDCFDQGISVKIQETDCLISPCESVPVNNDEDLSEDTLICDKEVSDTCSHENRSTTTQTDVYEHYVDSTLQNDIRNKRKRRKRGVSKLKTLHIVKHDEEQAGSTSQEEIFQFDGSDDDVSDNQAAAELPQKKTEKPMNIPSGVWRRESFIDFHPFSDGDITPIGR